VQCALIKPTLIFLGQDVGIQKAYNREAGTTDDRTSNSVLRRLIQRAHRTKTAQDAIKRAMRRIVDNFKEYRRPKTVFSV